MRFLCKLGLHKFSYREVHITEPLKEGQKFFKTSIIEQCKYCGESRITLKGTNKLTCIIIPTKYSPTNKELFNEDHFENRILN